MATDRLILSATSSGHAAGSFGNSARPGARLGGMHPARRRLALFSAAILAVLAAVPAAGIASAGTAPAAETRVWASASAAQARTGADRVVSPGQRLGKAASCPFYAPGSYYAAEDTGGVTNVFRVESPGNARLNISPSGDVAIRATMRCS